MGGSIERHRRRWKDWSRAEKYAFIQSQALFWALYAVAIYLVATNVGAWAAVLVFGSAVLMTLVATFIGIRIRRSRASQEAGAAAASPSADWIVVAEFEPPNALAKLDAWKQDQEEALAQVEANQVTFDIGRTAEGDFARVRVRAARAALFEP